MTAPNRERARPLTPLKDVLQQFEALPLVAETAIPLSDAVSRVLAQDVVPEVPAPGRPVALRDGYAVKAEATTDATPYAPILLDGGVFLLSLGNKLPRGADAVAPLDAIQFDEQGAHALATITPGDGVLAEGADATPGMPFLTRGTLLRQSDLA